MANQNSNNNNNNKRNDPNGKSPSGSILPLILLAVLTALMFNFIYRSISPPSGRS